jgi:hypothetical protein
VASQFPLSMIGMTTIEHDVSRLEKGGQRRGNCRSLKPYRVRLIHCTVKPHYIGIKVRAFLFRYNRDSDRMSYD